MPGHPDRLRAILMVKRICNQYILSADCRDLSILLLDRFLEDATVFPLKVAVVAVVIIASKLIEIKHLRIVSRTSSLAEINLNMNQDFFRECVNLKQVRDFEFEFFKQTGFSITVSDIPSCTAHKLLRLWQYDGARSGNLVITTEELIGRFYESEYISCLIACPDVVCLVDASLSFSQLEIAVASILLAIAQNSALFVGKQTAFLTFLQDHLKKERGIELQDLKLDKCLAAFESLDYILDVRGNASPCTVIAAHSQDPPLLLSQFSKGLELLRNHILPLKRKREEVEHNVAKHESSP